MKYNFDKTVDRYNTASLKWDGAHSFLGDRAKGALPMWVADMDFQVAQEIIDALQKRVEHGIFGYPLCSESYYTAVIGWMQRHFNWAVSKEWIYFCPGIVPALNYIVQAFTKEGDSIMIQSPVYYPFTNCIVNNGRSVVLNCLKLENGRYTMDYEDLEHKLADSKVKLLILCNPHNPVGRVWSKAELTKLGEICLKHKVLVVSDEIHADLTFKGFKTTAFAGISEEFANNTIVCTAASKTFNLAGLQVSNIIIPNKELGFTFAGHMKKLHLIRPNIFGMIATETAYNCGDEWLEQVKDYLQANLDYLTDYINSNIRKIKVVKPEGTYLIWLDCRELGMTIEELKSFMLKKAKVAMDDGYLFGPGGEGFTRINIACPRANLTEALNRISRAVNE